MDQGSKKETRGVQYPEIASEILAMREVDQDMRDRNLVDDSWDEEVDRQNTLRMKEMITKIGWPTIPKVGEEASEAAWLLVQHADHDVEFQESCLALMLALPESEASKHDIAYLTDRIRVNRKQGQIYGTQFTQTNGKHIVREIEAPESIDERRLSMGLGTLEEGIKEMYKKYPL